MTRGDHRRVIVPATGAEGDEIGPQTGEDNLGGKDEHEGPECACQLGDINGHHGHAQKNLEAQIAERVQLLGPDLHMDGVQNVADDHAANHTADEVGKFDIGDSAGQNGDIGAQPGGYDDETYAAQERLPVQRDNGFSFRLVRPHRSVQMVALDQQSPDIAMGVDKALEAKENKMSDEQLEAIGAGDQGMMFGYATNETPELMPYPISLAHKLALQLTKVRKDGTLKYLRPDGKTQVSVEYDENGKPKRLEAVVLSTQHDEDVTQEQVHEDIKKYVFDPILPTELVDAETKFFINPTGRFVIGGPHGDAGLTGRKIIVDTYGGYARHGGGAFSGKDCTKVDRSAAYAARYVAKNIVAAGLAEKCEIQLSYAIGVAQPTSIMVDTFGTGKLSDEKLVEIVRENFDLRPAGIIKMLDLRRPIYRGTAAYGHFGRTDLNLPWEATDKAEALKKYL